MSTISEVEEIIEELKESEKDVRDVFYMEDSELRDVVINSFVDSIDSNNSEPKVEELILLLKRNGIHVLDIDDNVEVLLDDFPRSILFYAAEKDDPDVDTIKLLKRHGFKLNYTLHPSRPADSLELIQKAKENLKRCCPTRRKSKRRNTTGKKSRNKSRSKSKRRITMG